MRIEDLDTGRVRPGFAERAAARPGGDRARLGRRGRLPVGARSALYADAHRRAAAGLYECFCTRAEIREAASAAHGPVPRARIPGTCLRLTAAERADEARARARRPRCACAPTPRASTFERPPARARRTGVVDDFVVRRNDGAFAYNLAVVVDDAAQGIEEVVRGADLLDSTPRQIWLARALGVSEPALRPRAARARRRTARRLAKRHGDVTLREVAAGAAVALDGARRSGCVGARRRRRCSPAFDPRPRFPASRRSGAGRLRRSLVGRKDERARLTALLEAAREGAAARCCCTARRGSARPRCCAGRSARPTGFRVLRARGDGDRVRHPVRRAGRARHAAARPARRHPGGAGRARCAARSRSGRPRRTTASRSPPALLSPARRRRRRAAGAGGRSTTRSGSTSRRWRRSCSPAGGSAPEGVAMLGALRDGRRRRLEVPWLERLRIEPLADDEARELLRPQVERAPASPTGSWRPRPATRSRCWRSRAAVGRPARRARAARGPAAAGHRRRARVRGARSTALPRRRRGARCWSPRRRAHGGSTRSAGAAQLDLTMDDLEPAEAARIVIARRRRGRVPPPAAALDRLPRRQRWPSGAPRTRALAAAAPDGARSAPGTWRPARSRPTRRSPRRSRRAALDARGRGAHATAARDLGRAAQLTPGRRAARPPAARGGDGRRRAAARPTTRCRAARRRRALRDRPAARRRRRAHARPRRDAPRLAAGRATSGWSREAERVRSRDPRRAAGDVPRGVGRAHDHRRHARADRHRRARARARHVAPSRPSSCSRPP